jgi:hypothetical protein
MIDATVTEKGTEKDSTPGQPKTDSLAAAPQKDRDGGCDPKGPVIAGPSLAHLQMLIAFKLLNYHPYEGSVPTAVVRRRRKANKTARISRRHNRGRS